MLLEHVGRGVEGSGGVEDGVLEPIVQVFRLRKNKHHKIKKLNISSSINLHVVQAIKFPSTFKKIS